MGQRLIPAAEKTENEVDRLFGDDLSAIYAVAYTEERRIAIQ